MDSENFPIPDYEERLNQDMKMGVFYKICLIRAIRED